MDGGARLTLIAVVLTAVVLTVHDLKLRQEDQAIAEAVLDHFHFSHERQDRLEKRIAQLEEENAALRGKVMSAEENVADEPSADETSDG